MSNARPQGFPCPGWDNGVGQDALLPAVFSSQDSWTQMAHKRDPQYSRAHSIHTCIHTYVDMCVCAPIICTRTCTCVTCVYIYIGIHTPVCACTHTHRHTHAHMPWKFTLVYTRSTTENFRAFQAATLTRNLAKPASRVPERSHTLGSSRPKKSFVSSMAPTAANKERRSTDFMVETRTENPGTALRLQKLHSELRAGKVQSRSMHPGSPLESKALTLASVYVL